MKKCIDCHKECHHQAIRCRKCQDIRKRQSIIGINNPNYRHGETLKLHYCIDCKKLLSEYRHRRCTACENTYKFKNKTYEEIMGKNKAKEVKKIRSLSLGGTGIPYEFSPYPEEFNISLKESIRDRDNHECQLCHILEKNLDRKLDVHHIDYDKQNCKEENLISLCDKCHCKTNFNRDYWFVYFTEIINRIYQLI